MTLVLASSSPQRRAILERLGVPFVVRVPAFAELDGRLHGKPSDERAARAMLETLSGATHTVVSAIALLDGGETPRTASAVTRVRFRALAPAVLDWYVSRGEWRGRAGAYAIQEAGVALVSRIDGELSNVIGLPVGALLELLPALLAGGR